jgi:peptide/nickel transport system substrate-binding protein
MASDKRRLTRRDVLKAGGVAAGLGLLAACSPAAAPSPTAAPKAAEPTKAPAIPAPASASTPAPAAPAATQAPAAATKAAGPKKGGTFTLARTMSIQDFNPMRTVIGHYAFMRAFYNTLVNYDQNLQPQPELAEKWDISPDGKTVTLQLRQGVKFHSGREFTSADVKATYDFAANDESVTMRSMFKTIKGVETPDKYTVALKFDAVYPGVFDLLGMMYIIDKDTVKDIAKTAIGTGPFKMDKYIPSDRVELVPFADYWDKGKPYLDRYVIRDIPDLASLAINLESGAVDAIWQPNNSDYTRLQGQPGKFVTDIGAPGPTLYDIALNVTVKPLDNKLVRQAIAWSVDRARFCKTILQGMVEPTCLMWAKHSWAYQKDLEGKVGYDLDKAAALLKQSGVGSFDMELMTASKRGLGYGELAQILQADLKKIGINAKVNDVELAVYETRSTKGDIVAMVHTYGRANRDPGTLVTGAKAWVNEKEGNWTHWNNAAWDALRTDLNSTLDQTKRLATARKIQEMALDECFTIVVAPQQRTWVYGNYVKGFGYDLENAPIMANFWLDK